MITNEMAVAIAGILATAMIGGVGSAALYFKGQRKGIADDIDHKISPVLKDLNKLWSEMRDRIENQHEHDLEILSLQEKSVNNVRRLEEIKQTINVSSQETNRKIDTLSETLGRAILAFRGGKHE